MALHSKINRSVPAKMSQVKTGLLTMLFEINATEWIVSALYSILLDCS
jgi:hypothetical protein